MLRVRGALWLLALAVGGLFVVVAGALVVGVGGSGSDALTTDETTAETTTTEGARRSPGSTAVSFDGSRVLVSAATPYGTPAPVVGRLPSRTVVDISASGFPPSAVGRVEQCGVGGCANDFPVTFDLNGEARFQYLVRDDFTAAFNPGSTCRAGASLCVVKVSAAEKVAHFTTVFHDAAPAARRVTLLPGAGGLVDGAPVQVSVTGFEAGEEVQAMLCAAPDTFGPTRCGAPGPIARFTIGADGTGAATLTLREGPVGSGGARCSRGSQPCGVVVVDPRSAAPGTVAAFTFATGPGARYERNRLVIGLVVAFLLLALAAFLVRITDWRKPSEADTPELDQATLLD